MHQFKFSSNVQNELLHGYSISAYNVYSCGRTTNDCHCYFKFAIYPV